MGSLKIALNRLNREAKILSKEPTYHCYYTTNKHRPEIEETVEFNTTENIKLNGPFFSIYCLLKLEGSYYIIKLEWSLRLNSKIYPYGPPDLYFLTDNPYTLTNTKICNSFTKYHTSEWNPLLTIDQLTTLYREYYNSNNKEFTNSLNFIGVKHKDINSLKEDVEKFTLKNLKIILKLI
jgi:ubiquitin-protein ligase